MTLFLSERSLWVLAIIIVVLPTIAAAWGLVRVRSWIGLERLTTNNEVAGFKFAVVGVIYAVLLAFVVVVVWQRYSDAEVAVTQEAGATATLFRLLAGPEPEAADARAALSTYLRSAISRDWPLMARAKESPVVTAELSTVYAAAARLAQRALLSEIFYQLDLVTQARRNRLHLAAGVVPIVLWRVLLVGAALTVAFTYFFGTENLRAQVLMTGMLALIVFMGLFVIIAIDHPFTGSVRVGSGPLQQVLTDFAPG